MKNKPKFRYLYKSPYLEGDYGNAIYERKFSEEIYIPRAFELMYEKSKLIRKFNKIFPNKSQNYILKSSNDDDWEFEIGNNILNIFDQGYFTYNCSYFEIYLNSRNQLCLYCESKYLPQYIPFVPRKIISVFKFYKKKNFGPFSWYSTKI